MQNVFERVLPVSADPVAVFGVGSRSLVSRGHRFVGRAEPNAPYVEDASLSRGLPAAKSFDDIAAVAGRFPNVLAVRGHFAGSEGPPGYRAFVFSGKAWGAARVPAFDRVWSAAKHGAGYAVFSPDSFYLNNGMLGIVDDRPIYPCEPTPLRSIAVGVKAPALVAPASFFAMNLATDGGGAPVAWGYVACRPGVHAARLDAEARMTVEALPGTEGCTARDSSNGLPLAVARLYPAADGGAYALVGAMRWRDDPDPSELPAPEGPCLAAPLRLKRGPSGGWSAFGAPLPPVAPAGDDVIDRSAIDPAGTAYLVTRRATVLRVDATGAISELGLAASCLEAPPGAAELDEFTPPSGPTIKKVEAPFAGDVWVAVALGDRRALCRWAAGGLERAPGRLG
ncbi:MAG TPA: hypothetical protein VFS00_19335, partial [Polyangiaceae bacterium]|nr:hypothetical protein [Polyangiaceae bacterium]